jgi:hypothetical protein
MLAHREGLRPYGWLRPPILKKEDGDVFEATQNQFKQNPAGIPDGVFAWAE